MFDETNCVIVIGSIIWIFCITALIALHDHEINEIKITLDSRCLTRDSLTKV